MLQLQPDSLDWALQHALTRGDSTLFPHSFEFLALEHDWNRVRDELANVDVGAWTVRPHRKCLAPKGRYAFRVTTQLDPLDFLVYSALVYELGRDLEASRVGRSRDLVFSYRFEPSSDGRLFAEDCGWPEFVEATKNHLNAGSVTHVGMADIADFYPRVYHHPLENALASASSLSGHIRCILKLLKGWTAAVSHGVPVGNEASRLLAEAAIGDVDQALLAAGVRFIRFNDDYRIFCQSSSAGYEALATLANHLYEAHGLTLQPGKTRVLGKSEFERRFMREPADRAVARLDERFQLLLESLGLKDQYAVLRYEDLDEDQQALIDSLNLQSLFENEAAEEEPDLAVLRFILRRMGQLGDAGLFDAIEENIDRIHAVYPDVVRYLTQLRDLGPTDRAAIGRRWLDLLQTSVLAQLDYHRMWGLHVFAVGTEWDNEERLVPLLGRFTDLFSRREIVLSLGRAHATHWFSGQRRNLANESPWVRRAFIAAASCLPGDQLKHWYRSIKPTLDSVEVAVMEWAKVNRF